jgi:DNA-nicking Smr family endonuclease
MAPAERGATERGRATLARNGKRKHGPEDGDLWRAVTRSVRPLKGRDAPGEAAADAGPADAHKATARRPPPAPRQPAAAQPAVTPGEPELAPGEAAGVDKRTAERLRRGQLAIEARLDLHGMTQAEAHRALDGFIAEGVSRGRRCVLVITGKGGRRDAWRRDEPGVLFGEVPRWLNQPPARAHVLAIARARPRHGGEGALYVLLRRKR